MNVGAEGAWRKILSIAPPPPPRHFGTLTQRRANPLRTFVPPTSVSRNNPRNVAIILRFVCLKKEFFLGGSLEATGQVSPGGWGMGISKGAQTDHGPQQTCCQCPPLPSCACPSLSCCVSACDRASPKQSPHTTAARANTIPGARSPQQYHSAASTRGPPSVCHAPCSSAALRCCTAPFRTGHPVASQRLSHWACQSCHERPPDQTSLEGAGSD